ncbi:MAG TPA: hypothetical protein VFF73_35830 [Planctomycetota bacterium]|nr:hypothetical protein [Planctomycetota bacterium]
MFEHWRRAFGRGIFVLLGVAVVVAVLRSRPTSDEAGGGTPLPIAKLQAHEGDWATYLATSIEGNHQAAPEAFALRVVAVKSDRVLLRYETRHQAGDVIEGAIRELPSDRPPTVAEVFAPPGGRAIFEDVTVSNEPFTFAGRRFEGALVVYDRSVDGSPIHVVANVSAEVPGTILSVKATGTDQHGCKTTLLWELAGIGNGDKATLGKTLDELAGVGSATR